MKNKLLHIIEYIIILLFTVCMLWSIEIHKQDEAKISTLTQQNQALQQEMFELKKTADKQLQNIQQLAKENEQLKSQQTKQPETQKTNRGEERLISLGEYTITAYCSCEKCCGKRDRPNGIVYGAAGVELQEGISAAGWLPFGTDVMISGHKYTIQDRTAKWIKEKYDGKIIDLYFTDHNRALKWGKQEIEIFKVS